MSNRVAEPAIVPVALGVRSYDVLIGGGLLARAGALIAPLTASMRAFIITDRNVGALYGAALSGSLEAAGLVVRSLTLTPGEETKSFAALENVCRWMLREGLDRKSIVVALGGGVIGDLAGFAAGVAMRGVDFVQIPTTLLAQVDSSVGGKTAIDTPEGKNLVGLFHQPRLVLADLDVLQSLPERELRAGYAEVVKYGLIDDRDFYAWCADNYERILSADADALGHGVRISVEAKARIVAADEREAGARALLNLGHTFAHALEIKAGYSNALLHGEAVGVGLWLAYALSAKMGLCADDDAARVKAHLRDAGFCVELNALPGAPFAAEELVNIMAGDKKAEGGALTFILARGLGRAFVQKDAPRAAVLDFLNAELQRA